MKPPLKPQFATPVDQPGTTALMPGLLPNAQAMRNRRGQVVLSLHASAWLSAPVQRLSLCARAVLAEILVHFACGYRRLTPRVLAAMCRLEPVDLAGYLVELRQEGLVADCEGVVQLMPIAARELLTGRPAV